MQVQRNEHRPRPTVANSTNSTPLTSSRYEENLKKKIQENKEFNANIACDQDKIDQIEITDNAFLVRLYKHEGEETNDGFFMERKFKQSQTENGRPTSEVDDYYFSSRAIVLKEPTNYIKYLEDMDKLGQLDNNNKLNLERLKSVKVGDVVWLSTSANATTYAFFLDRRFPVASFEGYLLIPFGLIQVKENK